MKEKTIYLIRHGESVNNQDRNRIYNEPNIFSWDFWVSVGRCSLIPMDSELTEKGILQVQKQKLNYEAQNLFSDLNLILYSPLRRTTSTFEILFRNSEIPSEEEPLLTRKYPSEYLYSYIETRIDLLKKSLIERPEQTIALIGHSRIFQMLIDQSSKIENSAIWKINLSIIDGNWSNLIEILPGGEYLVEE